MSPVIVQVRPAVFVESLAEMKSIVVPSQCQAPGGLLTTSRACVETRVLP